MTVCHLGQALIGQARARRHRRIVVLHGSSEWGWLTARQLTANQHTVSLTTERPVPDGWVSPQLARQLLGREIAHAIIDTHAGIDADAVGIVGGAIRAGGLLCFLKPGCAEDQGATPFVARFWRLLAQLPDAIQIVEDAALPTLPETANQTSEYIDPDSEDIALPATPDQAAAVKGILAVVSGQRRRPALLVADRGRGKSAALGLAAGTLLACSPEVVVVTGASRTSSVTVFRHADAVCTDSSRLLIWQDPATLLAQQISCQLLLIDEAATLPLHILEQLLARYPRIAMATTVHGYEGSGRGFLLRFDVLLERHSRGVRKIEMTSPVRWADNDPVERAINKLLVLDATLSEQQGLAASGALQTTVERIHRRQLAESEKLIADLFSLLVLSHYKTRPNDLQTMLDNPRLRLYRLRRLDVGNAQAQGMAHGAALGVALVVDEGGLDGELGMKMAAGSRRPAGQVLPALLAVHGHPDAVTQSMQRIMRIVIHPKARRRGLGSRLLQYIISDSTGSSLTGSNFALSAPLLGFWQRNGFSLVQISQRRTVQSGRHSGTMLCSVDEPPASPRSRMTESLAANLPQLLGSSLRDLETPTILAILLGLNKQFCRPSTRSLEEVADVAFAARDPQNVPAALTEAVLHGLCNGAFPEPSLLVQRILQQRSWNDCECLGGEVGWRRGNELIREKFAAYLQWLDRIGYLSGDDPVANR